VTGTLKSKSRRANKGTVRQQRPDDGGGFFKVRILARYLGKSVRKTKEDRNRPASRNKGAGLGKKHSQKKKKNGGGGREEPYLRPAGGGGGPFLQGDWRHHQNVGKERQ